MLRCLLQHENPIHKHKGLKPDTFDHKDAKIQTLKKITQFKSEILFEYVVDTHTHEEQRSSNQFNNAHYFQLRHAYLLNCYHTCHALDKIF